MRRLLTALLLIFFCLGAKAQFQGLIVNEFSQGDAGNREYIELLVVGTKTCTDSTADLRNYIVDDQNGWYGGVGTGIATGHFRFTNSANWSKVPYGSIILLYNDAEKNTSITIADDPTDNSPHDYVYVVPINSIYIQENTTAPVAPSSPSFSYSGSTYVASGSNWTNRIGLRNAGDAVIVTNPSNPATAAFSIVYGFTPAGGFQTPTVLKPTLLNGGSDINFYLSDQQYTNSTSWNIGYVQNNGVGQPSSETPGAGNTATNTAWILSMRQPPTPIPVTNSTVCLAQGQTYTFGGSTLNSTGHYSHTFTTASGCDSTVNLYLVVSNTQTQSYSACGTYTYNGTTYTSSTVLRDTVKSVITNCDSIIHVINITVTPLPPPTNINACLGQGQSYLFNGNTLTSSGHYTTHYTSYLGCDSVVNLYLVVSNTQNESHSGCGSILYNGNNYTSSTVLKDTIRSIVNNCDSIIHVVNITIFPVPPPTYITVCISEGQSYNFNGLTLNNTGHYTTHYTSWQGCDSTVNLYLVVAQAQTTDLYGCNSYTYNGVTYTSSTVLYETLPSAITSCDSIHKTIRIHIGNTVYSSLTACIEEGQTYFFNGQNLSNTGYYADTLVTASGCDSIVRLYLTVSHVQSQNFSGCGSVMYNGFGYTSSTIVRDTVHSIVSGCDSIIHIITIDVHAIPSPTNITICLQEGQSYNFNGTTLVTTGHYTTHYTNWQGCDSTVNLYLLIRQLQTVNFYGCTSLIYNGITYTSSTTINETIPSVVTSCDSIYKTVQIHISSVIHSAINVCLHQGQTYNFNGNSLSASGDYTDTLTTQSGCDSIVHIHLVVSAIQTQSFSGCGSYTYNGITYTSSTIVRDTIQSVVSGCDSIIHVTNINIIPPPLPAFISACLAQGQSYNFNGTLLNAAGHYTTHYASTQGCDSIVNLYLVVSTVQNNSLSGCGSVNFNNTTYTSSTIVSDTIRSTITNCDSIIHITTITVYQASPPGFITACVPQGQSYNFNGTVLNATGHYTTHYTNSHGCDSTVNLYLVIAQSQTLDLYGCSSLVYNGTTYTTSTSLTETLPSVVTGCDSIHRTVNIHISSVVYASLNVCLSQGQSYDFNGTMVNTTGFYTDTLTAQAGCDSIVRLYLVVSNTQNQNYSACGSITYNGITYTSSTIVRDTVPSLSGCDSIIHVANITIIPPPAPVQTTACIAPGQTYTFNGNTLQSTGHYTTHYTTALGCDSTVNLYLLVAKRDTIHLQGCSSVFYNGNNYTSSTTLYDTLPSSITSCDSIYRTIQIGISSAVSSTQMICLQQGQNYNFNGTTITASGHYIDTLSSAQGCDSIIHLYLVVNTVQTQNINGCSPLVYNGVSFTSSAVVRDTVHSIMTGCDSIIHIINITVFNASTPTGFQHCIGEGQSYNFNGTALTATGFYTTHYSNSQGCDSTVHLYLVVTKADTLNLQGCSSVSYNGNTYTTSTVLHQTIPSVVTGCDSLHRTINIVINNSINTSINICLQQGQSYNFNGTVLNTTGHYVHSLTAQQGCDSIVHLYLLVNSIQTQNFFGCGSYVYNGITYNSSTVVRDTVRSTITNCDSIVRITNITINNAVHSYTSHCLSQGQSYNFNGQVLTASGSYTATYPRPGQCDSIVHLYLLVSSTVSQTLSGCGSVNYNGTNYTSSAVVRDTLHSIVTGCDSIYHVVNITVSPQPVTNVNICIVSGQSYNFNGQVLNTTGHYSTTYARPNQCDSIVNLFLLVQSTQVQTITGCGTVVYNGLPYTSSTTVRDTVKSILTGCDSIIRIANIQLGSVTVSSIAVCRAPGENYDFNGTILSASGQYSDTLTSATGCDSIVHLFLVIAASQTVNVSGCESVVYNGATFTSSTILHETISSSLTGCDSVLRTINVVVNPKPSLTISPDKTVCTGTPVTLTANSPGSTINWPGFGAGNSITVTPATTTSYTAEATSANGCTNNATVTITVQDFNLVLSTDPNPVIAGTTTHLQTSAASSYQVLSWQPSSFFSNQNALVQQLITDSSINVMVIARSSTGCIDTASVLVVVDPLGDIFIPSAFTPNGDGKNDLFKVLGGNIKELDMKIYNRWGQMIFNSHERMKGWDGTVAGKAQATGTYVYTIRAVLKNGSIINKKGTVLLIR